MNEDRQTLVDRVKSARLVRVLLVYLGASWVVIQILDILAQQFTMPAWFFPAGLALLALGLPILVATALIQQRVGSADPQVIQRLKARGTGLLGVPRAWFTWKRAILGGVAAFAVLGGIGALMVLDRGRGVDELDNEIVAVMPFHPVGTGLDLWAEGMVDLLSTALDGTGAYHASDPRAVILRWGRSIGEVGALAEPEEAARVASDLGAGRMILGSVIETGPGEVRIAAELFSTRWLRKVASAAVEGSETEMTSLVDRLTVDLLKAIWSEGEVPEVRVSTITTASIPALRAYLEGERAFRQSRFTDAQQGFGRAVELDSTFAIAAHRLSFAYGWALGAFEEEHIQNALLAARHTDGLPARDSLLISGHKRVDIDGDLTTIQLYENLTRRYPEDYEAWVGFGEALYHLGNQVGYGFDRVVDAMARAYGIDPTIAPSLFHLIQGLLIQGKDDDAGEWVDRYLAIDSASVAADGLKVVAALRLGPAEDSARAVAALDTLDLEVFRQVYFFGPPSRTSLEYTELVTQAAAAPRFAPPDRAVALEGLGREYLRHGRIEDWLATDREADRIQGRENELFFLTVARLTGLLDDPAAVGFQEQLAARESYPRTAHYLAPLYAQQGRLADAQRAVDWLEARADSLEAAGDPVAGRAARGYALAYEGHIAAARHDAESAIDRLQQGLARIPGHQADLRNIHRYLLADLIESRDELEAMRIFGSLYYSPWLEAIGYLRRAEIHERRGEPQDALQYYGWFLELWEGADPHLQPQVQSAQRAVGRLSGDQVAVR